MEKLAEDMGTCISALSDLIFVVKKMTKSVMTELSRLNDYIEEMPAIKTCFVHARSYIIKCHELAEYVCNEEEYTIKAIEESKAEEFQDYLKEVLSKSQNCQKDMKTFMSYIRDIKPAITEEEETKRASASAKAKLGASVAVAGGITAVSAGLSIASVGLQGVIFPPIGIAVASVGLVTAYKGRNVYSDNKQKEEACIKILKAMEGIETSLEAIDETLEKANSQFKVTINAMFKNPSHQGTAPNKYSLIEDLRKVTTESKRLKDYCREGKDEDNFENFIMISSYDMTEDDSN